LDYRSRRPLRPASSHWRFQQFARAAAAARLLGRIDGNDNKTILFDNGHWRTEMYAPNTKGTPMSNLKVPISFDRDGREVMGKTIKGTNGNTFVEISVNPKIVADILESFAKAGQLTIEFREGDEQPWVDRMITAAR
jgi:hypothetical protein